MTEKEVLHNKNKLPLYLIKHVVLVFSLILLNGHLQSQSLSELQEKKKTAEREIELTTKLLGQARQQEKASLNRLQLITTNINQRNQLIAGLNTEIGLYRQSISNNQLVIDMVSDDLEKLKEEYARMVRLTYISNKTINPLLFLFSAQSFNQAYRRLLYMKRYASARNNQAEAMKQLQLLLNEKTEQLEQQKQSREKLLVRSREESRQLTVEKEQQNQEVQKLKNQQRDLRQKLEQQQKVEQQLEREIQKIIAEEARKSRSSGEPGFALTPEQKLTGNNFSQNKLRLPWPVERGVITEKFGIHRHPVLEKVQVRNNGINIATEPGSKARAVFNGEVSRVFGITGGNSAIIIRHGSYLTVYSNLYEVSVKSGDKVSARQPIGTVYTDPADGNKTILKFQVWHENQKLNPEEWLGK